MHAGDTTLEADEARRRVLDTLAARGTRHGTAIEGRIPLDHAAALHEQLLIERNDLEQVLRARGNAVAAGGALRDIDDGEAVGAHGDGVEGARDRAIAEAEA